MSNYDGNEHPKIGFLLNHTANHVIQTQLVKFLPYYIQ